MFKIIKHIIFFYLSFFVGFLKAQNNNNFYIEKKLYTYLDGLPGRAVIFATQDSKGYMWFITNNGLCRFDGKNFKSITQQSHGLFNNNIKSIISDKGNGVIITYFTDKSKYTLSSDRIDVIDVNTLKVENLKKHYKNVPFSEGDVAEIRTDPDENNVLIFLKPYVNNQIKTFINAKVWRLDSKNTFSPKTLRSVKAISFVKDKNGATAKLNPFSFSMPLKNNAVFLFDDNTLMCRLDYGVILQYKDNKNGYLLRYDDTLVSKYFYLKNYNNISEISPNSLGYPKFILDKSISTFTYRMDYTGVVFRQNNSLFLYNENNDLINLIDSTDDKKIRNAQILAAFRDGIGNYWISTSEGVLKLTIKQNKFHQFFTSKQIPFGLNNSIRGFYKKNGDLLIAAFDFIGIKKSSSNEIFKNHYNFTFCEINDSLWIGASYLELHSLIEKKRSIRCKQIFGEFWALFPLNTSQLLVGCTNKPGIFDISNNTLSSVNEGNFPKPNITYDFFEKEGKIFGVSGNGIYIYNKKGEIVDCYNKKQKDLSKKLEVDEINDLYIDKQDLYWICTAFDGLYCWDRKSHKLEHFGIENGFLSTTHYRIEEDDFNNLWISTDFGLAKFNKKTKRAKIFTEADGVSHNEFNRISSFKDDDGTMYFGGMNGVTYFHPKDFFEEEKEENYPFVINSLNVYNPSTNEMEDYTEQFNIKKEIVLNGNIKKANIEVALLDLEERVHAYAYQIVGLETKWNYIKNGNINLTNLPYGKFTLKVKAQCLNGLWNKTEIVIPIDVPVPFYKSLWFISLVLIGLIIVIIFIIKQRIKILKRQNEKLEKKVEVRTLELEESLAEQIALLQEVHHRVKNNLQFISAMLKIQLNNIKDEANQKILKETSRRINAMSLVHEMLYNKEKLEYVSLNEYMMELITKLKEIGDVSAEPIEYIMNIDDIKFNINNCVAIGMITSEIISNAIKYAFLKTSNPVISIQLVHNEVENEITYTISDNGIGILNKENKTGIGLRLIDIFSRQMEASYETINDNGIKYVFKIPYNKNEY